MSHQPPRPSSRQSQGQAPSPMDWSKYMAFPTPPVGQNLQADAQQYKNFAAGIDGSIPDLRTPGAQQAAEDARSPYGNGDLHGLDPSAFQREVRFQVPAFLNPSNPAPTFPNGAEAWSGYAMPPSMGGPSSSFNGGSSGFTPTANVYPPHHSDSFSSSATSEDAQRISASDKGKGVLEGLSGFFHSQEANADWSTQPYTYTAPKASGTHHQSANLTASWAGFSSTPDQKVQSPPFSYFANGQQQQQSQQAYAANGNRGTLNLSIPPNGQSQDGQAPLDSPFLNGKNAQSTTVSPSTQLSPVISTTPRDSTSSASSVAMSTSALLPTNYASSSKAFSGSSNVASSSSAPYAGQPTSSMLAAQAFMGPQAPNGTEGPGLYSTTGFDMLGVLSRVAARKDPKTVLGPVDFSCSFLVVDIRRYDSPIVYVSPTFSALTGYDPPSILGKNCRFLQSPDGDVVKGSKRKYTDNVAVAHLKRMLNAGKECQASLINYRRGGVPFINLVTVVPIPWEGTDIVYHVGFQVDLVEQPNAILRNMRDGTYQVNYTVANPPQPPMRPPGRLMDGNGGLSKEVIELLGPRATIAAYSGQEDAGKMEWLKMVLENTDDFVHVLSLKGQFQYVSPSVRRVLEYDPEDLVGKNISDICHPSDIVPLMRELKDSTHAPGEGQIARSVSLLFRIRRKTSGYVWIECTGRLHVEAGKGRKAVILSGRAKSIPHLTWETVAAHGGLGEVEFWAKLSFDGLIVHATNAVAGLLGMPVDDVVGRSLYSLLATGDDGPPASVAEGDAASPAVTVAKAMLAARDGSTKDGATSACVRLFGKMPVDAQLVFYATKHSDTLLDDDSQSDGASSESVITANGGVKPCTVLVQVKAIFPSPPSNPTHSRPIVHTPSANIFEELETTRGTSWQYELHQLRLLNRRLKEDVASARSLKASGKRSGSGKGKRRKGTTGDMLPPPMPDVTVAAPRHQLTPGFGFVAPGKYV